MTTVKKQHYVPQAYIKSWENIETKQVFVYDLHKLSMFVTTSSNILHDRYLYEDDVNNPDNRIESVLSQIESKMSDVLRKLLSIKIYPGGDDKKIAKALQNALGLPEQQIIKTFVLCQYLRIPGALDQKLDELNHEKNKDSIKQGEFLETGFGHIKNRFFSMRMLVNFCKRPELITSDWPCFEMMDSKFSPLLGEEIGSNPGVIAYFPVTPKINMIFYPYNFGFESSTINHQLSQFPESMKYCLVNTKCFDKNMIVCANELVIQQAMRFVVSNSTSDYILEHAKQRPRNTEKPR